MVDEAGTRPGTSARTSAGTAARFQARATLLLAPVLAAAAPSPSTSWATLTGLTGSVTDPLAPLVATLALAAWACSGWLLLVAVTTWGSRLPGAVGRLSRRTSARLAPTSVRALVRVALGATVVASVVGAPGAFADPPHPAARSYDWPALPVASGPAATFDWPSAAPTPARARPTAGPTHVTAPRSTIRPDTAAGPHVPRPALPTPAERPVAGPDALVVQPGDSLWAIAARHLGPTASEAQVAQAWPQWWHANRAVVGDDPNLIHPGSHLAPPSQG
jgi:hypothetical protein